MHYRLRNWAAKEDDGIRLRKAHEADGVKGAIEVIDRILERKKVNDE